MDGHTPQATTNALERSMALLALVVVGNVVVSTAFQEALFLALHPRARIPLAMLLGSLVAAAGALAASALLRRASPTTVLRASLLVFALGAAGMAVWNRTPSEASTFASFLFVELAATVSAAALWTYVQAPLDPAGTRRLLPRFNACASVGAMLAGLALPFALRSLTAQGLILPSAVLWLAAIPLVRSTPSTSGPRHRA